LLYGIHSQRSEWSVILWQDVLCQKYEKLKKENPKNGEGSSKKKDVKIPKSSKRKSEMEDIIENVQAQNYKLLETLRKQHNQKMRKMDRFLTIFKKSVRERKEQPKDNGIYSNVTSHHIYDYMYCWCFCVSLRFDIILLNFIQLWYFQLFFLFFFILCQHNQNGLK